MRMTSQHLLNGTPVIPGQKWPQSASGLLHLQVVVECTSVEPVEFVAVVLLNNSEIYRTAAFDGSGGSPTAGFGKANAAARQWLQDRVTALLTGP